MGFEILTIGGWSCRVNEIHSFGVTWIDTRTKEELQNNKPPAPQLFLKIFISMPTVETTTVVRSIDLKFDSIEEVIETYLDVLESVSAYEVLPERREKLADAIVNDLIKEKEARWPKQETT